MERPFKHIIDQLLKPLLKEEGYQKKKLSFYKENEELIHLINIQKSSNNSNKEVRFYINCGIYSKLIDKEINNEVNENPKEYQCHYTERIEEIIGRTSDVYIIPTLEDVEHFKIDLKQNVLEVIAFFKQIKDTLALIRLIGKRGTPIEDEIFTYCIRKNLKDEAQEIVSFFKKNIDEERWDEIFKERFIEIIEEEDSMLKLKFLD